jgi:hypothetical protein
MPGARLRPKSSKSLEKVSCPPAVPQGRTGNLVLLFPPVLAFGHATYDAKVKSFLRCRFRKSGRNAKRSGKAGLGLDEEQKRNKAT